MRILKKNETELKKNQKLANVGSWKWNLQNYQTLR